MSALEGVLTLVAEFVGGLDGWFGLRRKRSGRGELLRSRLPVLLSGDAGEKGRFLTTLPKGVVVRVERVSGGEAPLRWATLVDDNLRQTIVPEHLRGVISAYQLEIRAEDYRQCFEVTRLKADPSPSLRSGSG